MSTGLGVFDNTVEKTNLWLKELENALGVNRQTAYEVLRAVLHTVRDRITIEEAAHFAAQLPMLVRGIFYEGWQPSAIPKKFVTLQEFIAYASAKLQPGAEIPIEKAARCVFASINKTVTEGEARQVRHMLPKEIQELWLEPAGTGW
jgi:uncharacterized protein (DUF2267 family)